MDLSASVSGQDGEQTTRWQADEARWSGLMAASHQGDKQAYATLLSELSEALTVYVGRQFGQGELVEDCVQECLLAIHHARHTYDPQRPFRPWLFTIARHKTIDILRQANRHTGHASLSEHVLEQADDISAEGLHRLLDGAKMMLLLPADYREVLVMTKYMGLTTLEVAERIGMTESAVKARLRRGLKKVQAIWDGESIYS